MQNWKRKAPSKFGAAPRKKWLIPALTAFFLVLTLVMAAFDFPMYWNQGAAWVGSVTGLNTSSVKMSETPYRLGLDLQGGTHLIYEADVSAIAEADREAALEGVRDVIERRVNSFGVSEPLVTTAQGNRIIVDLAGVLNVSEAIKQIGETPVLEFKEENTDVGRAATPEEQKIIDEKNAAERQQANDILARAKTEDWTVLSTEFKGQDLGWITIQNASLGSFAQAVLDQKTKPGAVTSKVVEQSGVLAIVKYDEKKDAKRMELSHILICFEGKTGCTNPISALEANIQLTKLREGLTAENFAEKAMAYSTDESNKASGGYLGWVEPDQTVDAFEMAASYVAVGAISETVETEFGYHVILKKAEETVLAYHLEGIFVPLTTLNSIAQVDEPWKSTGLTGQQLKTATVEFDQNTGAPHVALQFNSEGADLFGQVTSRNVGKRVAIFLDGSAISTPTVQDAIYGGQAVITGSFSLDEAKTLAQRLNAGALPVPVSLISQQTVGPILGQASLNKSIIAALAGFALVGLFMIGIYRLPGIVAVFALVLYALLNLIAYRIFGVTISLSGIAGLVLSIGMAVDANVLIFERTKEELRAGRDLRSAIDEGFRRAWPAIRDGNITTLIASVVLYGFSSSFVKGFALTLSIGVLLSMFSAISVTRTYLLAVQKSGKFSKPWMYFSGIKEIK
ncbi:MAG: protein translocase subunit SecD [Candidatus Uhrbacteria bacterium]